MPNIRLSDWLMASHANTVASMQGEMQNTVVAMFTAASLLNRRRARANTMSVLRRWAVTVMMWL